MSVHIEALWAEAKAASNPEKADEILQTIWDFALHQGTLYSDAPLVLRLFLLDLREKGFDIGTLWGIECALAAARNDDAPTIAAEVLSEIRAAQETFLGLLPRPCPEDSHEPCEEHYLAAKIALEVGAEAGVIAEFLRANPTRHRAIWTLIADFGGMSRLTKGDLLACLADGPTETASLAAFWLAAGGAPEGPELAANFARADCFAPTPNHAEAVAQSPAAFDLELIRLLFQRAWDLSSIESVMTSLLRHMAMDDRTGWETTESTIANGRLAVLHPDVRECLGPPIREADLPPLSQLLHAKSRLKLIDTDTWGLFGLQEPPGDKTST